MKQKLVCVTWIDAHTAAGWFTFNPKQRLKKIKSFGLLAGKTPDAVVIASTFDPDTGHWCDEMAIPHGMVQSVKVIQTVEV